MMKRGRLRITSIGISAPVIPVGVAADGTLGIPDNPAVVGWWAGGGSPGQASGTTVLVGHVDSAAQGPGAGPRAGAGGATEPPSSNGGGKPDDVIDVEFEEKK